MAVLTSSIINRVLDQFRYRDPVLTINSAVIPADSTIDVDDFLPNIGQGSIIQINEEYVLVTDYDGTGPMTLTVKRGWLNTTAGTHAQNDPVYVNPRVLGVQVIDLINECLDLMYPNLYAVDNTDLIYSGNTIGYNLPTNLNRVLRVDYESDSASSAWNELLDWDYKDNADTSVFSNGKALMVRGAMGNGAKIKVVYSKSFTRVATAADDLIAVAGLSEYMTDLLFYYAMARLLSLEEIDRSDASGAASHQIAQDVPPFLALRTSQWYDSRYADLLVKATARLKVDTKPRTAAGGYGR